MSMECGCPLYGLASRSIHHALDTGQWTPPIAAIDNRTYHNLQPSTMPLPKRWHKTNKNKRPPAGFEVVEPTLEALEHELRDQVKDTNEKKRKIEAMWPVHQISWQKSRYIYDMYYTYERISKQVYQYCLQQKLVDAALIAKVRRVESLVQGAKGDSICLCWWFC